MLVDPNGVPAVLVMDGPLQGHHKQLEQRTEAKRPQTWILAGYLTLGTLQLLADPRGVAADLAEGTRQVVTRWRHFKYFQHRSFHAAFIPYKSVYSNVMLNDASLPRLFTKMPSKGSNPGASSPCGLFGLVLPLSCAKMCRPV